MTMLLALARFGFPKKDLLLKPFKGAGAQLAAVNARIYAVKVSRHCLISLGSLTLFSGRTESTS